MEHVITIKGGGKFGCIYDDEVAPLLRRLGPTETVRASHCEPMGDGWGVEWEPWVPAVESASGFATRQAALAWERQRLLKVL